MTTHILILYVTASAGLALSSMRTCAQQKKGQYAFGVQAGTMVYQGDLNPSRLGSLKTMQPSLGLHAAMLMGANIAIRAGVIFGKLKGDESKYASPAYRQDRNFSFTSPVTELSGNIVWNPLGKLSEDKKITPFLSAGLGMSVLKIRADWSGMTGEFAITENSDLTRRLAEDAAHQKPRLLPVAMMGIGLRYQLRPQWALSMESTYRFTPTDHLDGFSRAANAGKRDQYMTHSMGIVYCSGKGNRLGCPKTTW
jgi:hypothetical protein